MVVVLGASWLGQVGEAEALGFSFALVPPDWWDRGDDVGFCNRKYHNAGNWYCAIVVVCLVNIAGLLSSASRLVPGANADPCEPY